MIIMNANTIDLNKKIVAIRHSKKVVALRIRIDGWKNYDFTSFSTVFHSYQDDGGL